MARARIAQRASLHIDKNIRRGHEMIFEFSAQRPIQAREQPRRIACVFNLRGKRHLQH